MLDLILVVGQYYCEFDYSSGWYYEIHPALAVYKMGDELVTIKCSAIRWRGHGESGIMVCDHDALQLEKMDLSDFDGVLSEDSTYEWCGAVVYTDDLDFDKI